MKQFYADMVRLLLFTLSAKVTLSLLKHSQKRLASTSKKLSSNSIADFRKEYSSQGIDDGQYSEPFALFKSWLEEAINANVLEPNAMCLATAKDNKPSSRYVLLKDYDNRGFVWYTNYNSRKSEDLTVNPYAALTFWWGDLERSVRIEGSVEKVSEVESDAYFNSRPRGSQIGAWSSNQSNPILNREMLQQQEQQIIEKFKNVDPVPRPQHWGGFRLVPTRIEFWKGRASRLHDRIEFTRTSVSSSEWTTKRLQP